MVRRRKIPEKGETHPATVRQRARLRYGFLKTLNLENNPIGVNFNKPVVEECAWNSASDNLIGKPKIRPWLEEGREEQMKRDQQIFEIQRSKDPKIQRSKDSKFQRS